MLDILGLLCIGLIAVAVIIVTPSLVFPIIYTYLGNYRQALIWMKRYFRHDMAFYSSFDLVYLYIINGQFDDAESVYRSYEQKGNRGSEYFVRMWLAAHRGDWRTAEAALREVEKYTITSDLDLKELAVALKRQDVAAIDNAYLIDMSGSTTITPSLFRVTWVGVLGVAAITAALFAVVWIVTQLTT